VVAAAAWLRDDQPLTRGQRIGSVGFCMGGALSGLLAVNDTMLAAAAVFYGMPPEPALAKQLACPMLGNYAGRALDARINDKVPAWAEACAAAGKRFEHVFHEGAVHAFFNDGRPSYHVNAARDSFARVLAFFRENLAP
jgi:carboxymethylenebutenolidase